MQQFNLPINAIGLAKEYPYDLKYKDSYLHIQKSQLPTTDKVQRKVRVEASTYIVFNDLRFKINLNDKTTMLTEQFQLVIPEKFNQSS